MRRSCPSCQYHWAYALSDGRFKCRRCGSRYTSKMKVWDIFRLSDRDKRRVVEYFVLGVPVYRLRFRGPASQPTLKRYFRIIRQVLAIHEHCREPFEGVIEADEALFGGKRKGKRGWGAAEKILVFGMLKRNGRVKVHAVRHRDRDTLLPIIARETRPGSLYYTDDWHAYGSLSCAADT